MKIICTKTCENGSHDYTDTSYIEKIPEDWAILPMDTKTLENFPFGEVEVDYSGKQPVVAAWIPGIIPEPEPAPAPDDETSVWDELDAAYQEGVDSV